MDGSEKILLQFMFFSKSFIVSGHAFRSLIHFELIFVYGIRKCSSFILFFLIFIFTLFYFAILYWFCHTLTWIHHRCTCIPKHEPPSHLPPHNISLGHPRVPAPSILYPASDIDWRFDSYMILYMFQCHSPKSKK